MIFRYGSQGNNPAPCQRHCSAGTVYPVRPILPGSPAPSHVQCDLGGNNHTGSGAALNPWTQLTQIPVHGRLNVRMWRALTCTARGCPGAGASSLSCVLLAPACPKGIARSWAMPPAAWALGPAPLESLSQGRASPASPCGCRSCHLSCPGACGVSDPALSESASGVWRAVPTSSVSVPGHLGFPLPLLGSCPSSL